MSPPEDFLSLANDSSLLFTAISDLDHDNSSVLSSSWPPSTSLDYYDGLDDHNKFVMTFWWKVFWNSLFIPMIVIATGGNMIVIWIVWTHKRMRTVTNIFLVNLAAADSMVSTLNVTFNFAYMLTANWMFGNVYCKISQFVANLTICASVFTLTAIAIDRYIAIMYPLRPRMRFKRALTIVAVIWIISVIASLPNLLAFTTITLRFSDGSKRVVCYGNWPDGPSNRSHIEYMYILLLLALTYVLPILLMLYTYLRIGFRLWVSESIGEVTQRQNENIKSKRRVVKMLIIVVLIFAICWLPFHVYFILTAHWPDVTAETYVQHAYLGIYWLAMSNSMYNPIIYCWLNTRFRQGFGEFFSCCPFVPAVRSRFSRREVVTSRYNSCSGSPEAAYRIIRNGTVCIPLESSELSVRTNSNVHPLPTGRFAHQTYRRWYSQDNSNANYKS